MLGGTARRVNAAPGGPSPGRDEALHARSESLRDQSEGLGELAGERLVPHDERQLDDLGVREMLPELRDARIGHLLVLARDAFGILERRSLARREPIALPVAP